VFIIISRESPLLNPVIEGNVLRPEKKSRVRLHLQPVVAADRPEQVLYSVFQLDPAVVRIRRGIFIHKHPLWSIPQVSWCGPHLPRSLSQRYQRSYSLRPSERLSLGKVPLPRSSWLPEV